jgi:hypothetical protein
MNKIFTFLILIFVVTATAQSQITWSTGINIASNTYSNFHPRITTDGAGNPVIIWNRLSDGAVFFVRWNGSAFTTPVRINPAWLSAASGSWMGADIASKGDTIYVSMKRTPEDQDTNHIYIVHSFDGGMTFSAPSQVDFIADSLSRFPAVTVDDSGNPLVAFMKFDASFGRSRWVVAKSVDFGTTFSVDVLASGWSGGSVCDCCPGTIVHSGSTVNVIYRDNLSNIRDTWTGISADGGTSFTNGWNVDQNNWNLSSCPASGPDGAIVGDSLYSVFMNAVSGMDKVYRSVSSVSSAAAQTSVLLSNASGLTEANYPRIANYGNAVAIVWRQTVSGNDQLPLLFTTDISNGFPASYDTVDLGNITNADVSLSNGNLYVIWEDDGSATVKFRKGTFTPVTTSIAENKRMPVSVFPNPVFDELKINNPYKGISTIKIQSAVGTEVFSGEIDNESSNIDVSALSEGIYFLEIISGKEVTVFKIMKQ